jgi:archaemetzincin
MDASEESLSMRRTDSDSSRLRSRRVRAYAITGATLIAILLAGIRWWMSAQPMDDGVLAFRPPTASEREAAIGDTRELSPELQRAFRPSDDFPPIAKPGPRDWLTHHFEGGQSFAEFVRSEPNRLDERRVIYLQPIGEFVSDNAPSLDKLRDFTEAYFTLETKLMPTLTLAPDQVTTRVREGTERPQWLASDLLTILEPQLPPDAYCLVGVTLTDLFSSSTPNFVFGQASIRNRTGVFSFARFDPAFYDEPRHADVQQLILRRSCHTLAHEICHIFGMHHCIYFSCPVNGSNHLAENDSRPMHLCPVCLRKLHFVVGFDPAARDRDLLAIYQRFGFANEAEWTQRRLGQTSNP